MKPLIGIIARMDINTRGTSIMGMMERYRISIIEAGGVPLCILPPSPVDYITTKVSEYPPVFPEEQQALYECLDTCDGILMPGGDKISNIDKLILEYAIAKDIPILGICLGMQIMLSYQKEFETEPIPEGSIQHYQFESPYAHQVNILKESELYRILGQDTIEVNSLHNRKGVPNEHYRIAATSPDGVIEGVEKDDNTFHIGIQWHPEKMYEYDENSRKILKAFIAASTNYKNQKNNLKSQKKFTF